MAKYIARDKIIDMKNELPHYMEIKGYDCARGHMMRCIHPDHEDRNPSMAMFQGHDGLMRLHCFGCGRTFDVFDAVSILDQVFGIPNQYAYLCQLLGYNHDEIKKSAAVSRASQQDIERFALNYTPYWKQRGITDDVVKKYRLGYDEQSDCVIIPIGESSYVRRYLHRNHTERYRKSKGFSGYLNIENLTEKEPIIICEGEMDTLSIISCGYMNVVSAGGAANVASLVGSWHYDEKLILIEALDRDSTGRKQAEKLRVLCQNKGYVYRSIWEYLPPSVIGKDINAVWSHNPHQMLENAIAKIRGQRGHVDRGSDRWRRQYKV